MSLCIFKKSIVTTPSPAYYPSHANDILDDNNRLLVSCDRFGDLKQHGLTPLYSPFPPFQAQRYVAAGGNLKDLPPPPPMDTSDYIQCPHCQRR